MAAKLMSVVGNYKKISKHWKVLEKALGINKGKIEEFLYSN